MNSCMASLQTVLRRSVRLMTSVARISSYSMVVITLGTGSNGLWAASPDWAAIESHTIQTFYAGVASWQYLKGKDHGKGGAVISKMKKTCKACHSSDGNLDIKSAQIMSGEVMKVESGTPLEPEPVSDLPPFKDVEFKAAHDANNLYLHFSWSGSGASIADPSLMAAGRQDRIAIQVATKIRSFRNYGCLMVCHDDQTGMPDNNGEEKRLYGYYTRSKGKITDKARLDSFLSKEQFIDMWVVSFSGDQVFTTDEYVLEDRIIDSNDLTAEGSFENGRYEVTLTRKLNTGNPGDVQLVVGDDFHMSVGIFDNKHKGRKHYTSFALSVGLSAAEEADVAATKF